MPGLRKCSLDHCKTSGNSGICGKIRILIRFGQHLIFRRFGHVKSKHYVYIDDITTDVIDEIILSQMFAKLWEKFWK